MEAGHRGGGGASLGDSFGPANRLCNLNTARDLPRTSVSSPKSDRVIVGRASVTSVSGGKLESGPHAWPLVLTAKLGFMEGLFSQRPKRYNLS